MRIPEVEPLRRAQPRPRERVGHLGLLTLVQTVHSETLGDGLVDGVSRIQCSGWILEDQLRSPPVGLQVASPVGKFLSADIHRARRGPLQAEDRPGQCGFATTAFTDQCKNLPPANCQVDAVNGTCDITAAGTELDLQGTRLKRRHIGAVGGRHTDTSPARWQAASRSPCLVSSGSTVEHASTAIGQRGCSGHPGGRSPGNGGSPGKPAGA